MKVVPLLKIFLKLFFKLLCVYILIFFLRICLFLQNLKLIILNWSYFLKTFCFPFQKIFWIFYMLVSISLLLRIFLKILNRCLITIRQIWKLSISITFPILVKKISKNRKMYIKTFIIILRNQLAAKFRDITFDFYESRRSKFRPTGLNVPLNKLKESGQIIAFIESLWLKKNGWN